MDAQTNAPTSARRLPRAMSMMRALSRPRQNQQQSGVLISSPIGPVKSSRGADLVRSETLTVITSIGGEANKILEVQTPSLVASETLDLQSSAKSKLPISDSMQSVSGHLDRSKRDTLVGRPTVASSDITATTMTLQVRSHNQGTSPQRDSLKPSMSVPLLAAQDITDSTKGRATVIASLIQVQDENTPPNDEATTEATTQTPLQTTTSKIPKLPKSRTMGVLHELKASMSRPSTVASRRRRLSQVAAPQMDSSPSTDSGKTVVPASASSSRIWLPHSSLTSLVRSSQSCTPELIRPDQVTAAQPTAYWTGRFMALHDRYLSEAQERGLCYVQSPSKEGLPESKPASLRGCRGAQHLSRGDVLKNPASQLPSSNKTNLPHANTTSSLSRIMFKPPPAAITSEDDTRCHSIFTRLEECCMSAEARQSLQDWQHTYAKKVNRPSLLPLGREMNDKSRMARFFGGTSVGKKRHPHRQSLPGVPSMRKKSGGVDAVLGVAREKSIVLL